MGVLVIQPCGGLGNKLRALACAYNLSLLHNRELQVNWIPWKELPFDLGDIFEIFPFKHHRMEGSYLSHYSSDRVLDMPFDYEGNWYIVAGSDFHSIDQDIQNVHKNKVVFHSMFQFPQKLLDKAYSIIDGRAFSAVHLRYTDRAQFMSSDEYVTKLIDGIDGSVFLCSDNTGKANQFITDKVFYFEKDIVDRHSIDGIHNAIVDFIIMQHAECIYCPNSSFSSEASLRNDIPVFGIDCEVDMI